MPYTGIVLALVSALAGAFLVLLGHWIASAGLFPEATRTFAEIYDRRATRATLVGIFTFGPLMLLLLVAKGIPNPLIRLLVVGLGLGALLIALAGSAGLALRIGRNLCAEAGTWQQAKRGGTMLALVFITPFLGWFLLLPVGLCSGFGAFLLAKPWKTRETAPLQTPLPALS
jgi:hypothetical protein